MGLMRLFPLDGQVDDGGPPAEKEGECEEKEDEGHVVPLPVCLLLTLSRLAQYQPVADKDDGNDEHCDTRPGDPGGAFHWQGAGGEVRGFLVVLIVRNGMALRSPHT